MSTHHLRKDTTCQNCGHAVPERFCPACGQENVETRQSFSHLLRHFIEDFTHYEGNFWKTIKYLLFRPAYLTKTYLSGKRMNYVAPVKLYIFVSFIAFFIPAILPHFNDDTKASALNSLREKVDQLDNASDSILPISAKEAHELNLGTKDTLINIKTTYSEYRSAEEYDSVQHSLPASERDGLISSYFIRKASNLNHLPAKEVREKLAQNFGHNFPKALFVYLPLFAWVIWLFHGKKRWLFFDHAIFTLHYFSFILLLFTILVIIRNLIPWHFIAGFNTTSFISGITIWIWSVYYFYRAHRKMYEEQRITSALKSTFIFFVNTILFLVVMIAFFAFTIVNIH